MLQFASKKRPDGLGTSEYATHSDFCAIFLQQLDSLFLLALLLTGDELSAEECFLTAFDTCVQGSLVFKESAASWSRRSVIKTAIRFALPEPDLSRPNFPGHDSNLNPQQDASLKRLQELPAFDRFVFVMSVLERYSYRDCSLLLGCSSADILPARIRALHQISPGAEKSYPSHGSETQPYLVDSGWLKFG